MARLAFAAVLAVAGGCGMVNAQDGSAGDACYSLTTHQVTCGVSEATCLASNTDGETPIAYWYEEGSTLNDCCLCCEGCDESAEPDDGSCDLYKDNRINGECEVGPGESAGSCYDSTTHEVYCAVDEATCLSGNTDTEYRFGWYEPGFVSSSPFGDGAGCCHCCGGCNHTDETGTNCTDAYYTDGECGHVGGTSSDLFNSPATRAVMSIVLMIVATVMLSL
ncbi:Hypothetical Protein FCC1311_029142 [Hondaea fermentalgiana]|uniref:Uncharacterized protein n=1 Tax=Hondaea fermentalgiana TaxID=2315210 RepID=A0A2R5GDI0_9STRA|nr:Hypothetical Protein FCC1311_029142 [Hondaea fermentalgiana]|eukprot:GBG26693.1 Hypothetical Protein FCC1311_029142 [Hondaea fermentalgiana]